MDVENANCKWKVSQCTDMEVLPIERPLKVDREITGLDKLVEELHHLFSKDQVNVQCVQKLMAGYKSDPKDWRKYAKYDRFRYTRNLVDEGNGLFNIMILCWGPGHASPIHDHADSHCFMKLLSGSLEEVRYAWPQHTQPEVLKQLKNKQRSRCNSSVTDLSNGLTELDIDSCQESTDNRQKLENGLENGHVQNGVIRCHDDRCQSDRCQDGCGCEERMEEIGRIRLEVNDVCYINDALGLHRMENPSHVDGAVSLHLYCPPFNSCRVFDARTAKPTKVPVTFWSVGGKKVKRIIEANAADSQQ